MRFWSLQDYVPYDLVLQLQLQLVELRAQDRIPDTVLFLEHEPVITRGRGLQWTGAPRAKHMELALPLPPGIAFSESDRGGDLTYHGPGQLVIYPICKIRDHDLGGFIRVSESMVIDDLRDRGVDASRKEKATGIWIGDKKIASIGVAVKRWVTYHGIAINCVNDLKPFFLISPCGFQPEIMTRLCDWVPLPSLWRSELEDSIARRFASSRHFAASDESLVPGSGSWPQIQSFTLDSALARLAGEEALYGLSRPLEMPPTLNS